MSTTATRILAILADHYCITDPETTQYVESFTFKKDHCYNIDTDRGQVDITEDSDEPTTFDEMKKLDLEMIEEGEGDPDQLEIDEATLSTSIEGVPGFRILAD